jgi:hypothetical protein
VSTRSRLEPDAEVEKATAADISWLSSKLFDMIDTDGSGTISRGCCPG